MCHVFLRDLYISKLPPEAVDKASDSYQAMCDDKSSDI